MAKHTTRWEDAQVAEVLCDGVAAGCIMAGETETCAICGQKIRLVWHVYIEEVQ